MINVHILVFVLFMINLYMLVFIPASYMYRKSELLICIYCCCYEHLTSCFSFFKGRGKIMLELQTYIFFLLMLCCNMCNRVQHL